MAAIAVDQETGNLWVLANKRGIIYDAKTVVYDKKGKEGASYDIAGWDIAFGRKAMAFWIAAKKLTKLNAANGKVIFYTDVATWCASSVDVDPNTGAGILMAGITD